MRTSVDVHNFLLEREVPHELVPVRGRLRSPSTIPAALGLPTSQVGRVVLLEAPTGLVSAMVPANRGADPGRVAAAVGVAELSPLAPDRGTELTEFLAEATPPVALPPGTSSVMDRALDREEILYFPGGEISTVLKIRGADLLRVTEATVASVGA